MVFVHFNGLFYYKPSVLGIPIYGNPPGSSILAGGWATPLKNINESQLGWWNSQQMFKEMFQTTHQVQKCRIPHRKKGLAVGKIQKKIQEKDGWFVTWSTSAEWVRQLDGKLGFTSIDTWLSYWCSKPTELQHVRSRQVWTYESYLEHVFKTCCHDPTIHDIHHA